MATQKKITVFKRVTKTVKGKSENHLEEVKTDGTEKGSNDTILDLQKSAVNYFEVLGLKKCFKTIYTKMLSGNNYEIKSVKI